MRTLRGVLAAIAVATTMAACDPLDRQYFQSGIGTELYTPDLAAITQLQDVYLGELCRQSLPTLSSASVATCSNSWNLIVEAGMNDIDQRCDAYLSWLNDKRRTNAAVIKQLGDMAWATQNIMNITGASANPITIVGTAFGLATNTFTNVNSRLLFEVDRTTVQTLVLNRRNDYRKSMAQIDVSSRPAAVHALRSYLTICTPFAIETDINATVTIFQQGGAKGNSKPLVDPGTVAPRRADKPIIVTPPPRQPAPGTKGLVEPVVIGFERAKAIQRILCVPDNGDMSAPATRSALVDLKAALYFPRKSAAISSDKIEDEDQLVEVEKAVHAISSCSAERLAGPFEAGIFARLRPETIRTRIKKSLELAGGTAPGELVSPGTLTRGESIRAAVAQLRTLYKAKFGLQEGTSIDEATWSQIVNDNRVQ